MTPPDARTERTRSVVPEAADALMLERGSESTTIDAVAERAGVARSTVYRNWDGRSALFVDALEHLTDLPDPPNTGTLAGDLSEFANGLAAALTDGALGQLLPSLVSLAQRDDSLRDRLSVLALSRESTARDLFVTGLTRGEIEADDLDGRVERFLSPFFSRKLLKQLPLDPGFLARQVAAACRP